MIYRFSKRFMCENSTVVRQRHQVNLVSDLSPIDIYFVSNRKKIDSQGKVNIETEPEFVKYEPPTPSLVASSSTIEFGANTSNAEKSLMIGLEDD